MMAVLFGTPTVPAQTATDPYAGKTYEWIDSEGNRRVADLLDKATVPEQMKALVAWVYGDPTIPGQKKLNGYSDKSPYSQIVETVDYSIVKDSKDTSILPDNGLYANYRKHTTIFDNLSWESAKSYTDEDGKTHSIDYNKADVTPDKDGLTVLLIEMADNYQGEQISDYDEVWDNIKSIRVIPVQRQMRVTNSSSTENEKEKDGYLLNFNYPLNKFFIALKGDIFNRGTSIYAPLFGKYEQISPSKAITDSYGNEITDNNGTVIYTYVENAHSEMMAGNKFFCDHNCVSVPFKGHASMMGTSADTKPIPTSMYVYIPDNRFRYGYDPNSNFRKYNEYGNNTNGDFRPYYFIYKLTLTVPQKDVKVGSNGDVSVSATWTSTLKTITDDSEVEIFRLQRSYDGETWTDVPLSEITIDDENTEKDSDGLHTLSSSSTVNVKIAEEQYAFAHTVYYRTFTRPQDGTDFDEVVSNVESIVIPGKEEITTLPSLSISGSHSSDFDKGNQKNDYENHIFFDRDIPSSDYALTGYNLGTTEGETTTFRLKRFVNVPFDSKEDLYGPDATENVTTLAVIHVVCNGKTDIKGSHPFTTCYKYTATVIDLTGNDKNNKTVTLVANKYTNNPWRAWIYISPDGIGRGDSEINKLNNDKTELAEDNKYKYWLDYYDNFEYDIADKKSADGNTYSYRLFAEGLKNVKDVNGNSLEGRVVRSNIVYVTIPKLSHATGFNTYTLEQIKNDLDGTLEPSTPCSFLIPETSASNIDRCEITLPTDNKAIVSARHTDQGIWEMTSYQRYNTNQIDYATIAAGVTGEKYKEGVTVDNNYMGEDVVMTIVSSRGNTYGTPRIKVPVLPTLHIDAPSLKFSNGSYDTQSAIRMDVTSEKEKFHNHGYGVWALEKVRVPEHKEIKELCHHKHNVNAEKMSLNYNASAYSANAVANEFAGHTHLANATVNETRQAEAGTYEKPYYLWYRARNYSKYVSDPSKGVPADEDAEYIVVQNAEGSRYENGKVTGEADIETESNVKVYPSVTFDEISVEGEGDITVYNAQGTAVYNDCSSESTRTIDLSHEAPGMYIVTVNGQSFKVFRK